MYGWIKYEAAVRTVVSSSQCKAQAHLARGEHDGGHLRAVAPLGEEREQERLHEDGREERARQSVGAAALDAREDR